MLILNVFLLCSSFLQRTYANQALKTWESPFSNYNADVLKTTKYNFAKNLQFYRKPLTNIWEFFGGISDTVLCTQFSYPCHYNYISNKSYWECDLIHGKPYTNTKHSHTIEGRSKVPTSTCDAGYFIKCWSNETLVLNK